MKKSIGILLIVISTVFAVSAQTTEFTYQGSLKNSGVPANGNYDLEFKLFDAISAGAQQGSTVQRLNVAVANGIFTVSLDFSAGTLPGADRFLDIAVRTAGGGAFTQLTPRQKVSSTPYSVKSLNSTTADTATNATQLGGVVANQYVITTDPRMTNARPPTIGSADYIQNQDAGPQSSSNFNISGNGTVGGTLTGSTVTASTGFNIGANRVFGIPGANNTFAGTNAGAVNTGSINAFFGTSAGAANSTGSSNAFFGGLSGFSNTTGGGNSFFGRSAGTANTTGSNNSFFGSFSGNDNTTGSNNSFFGRSAGAANTVGTDNAFFGSSAGAVTTGSIGSRNSFFGSQSGASNLADENSFFGHNAGTNTTTGTRNVFIGKSSGFANTTGSLNTYVGKDSINSDPDGSENTLLGYATTCGSPCNFATIVGALASGSSGSVAVGYSASSGSQGFGNTALGWNSAVADNLTYATAIGADAVANSSNRIQLGRQDGSDDVRVSGNLILATLAGAGPTALCRNVFQQVATCSSSLRYKTNINSLASGLSLINQLKPITFEWKEGGMRDLGLGAEDVAAIEPLLVTYNDKGEVEGVKYDRIGVVLVNAVKEQQEQIETLQKTNAQQQAMIEQLEKRLEQLEKRK